MKKLVYSALALTLTGLPALATDNGWSGLDKEIESLSSSLSTADNNGPHIGGYIRTSYRHSSDDYYTGGMGMPDESGFQLDNVRLEIQGDVSDNYGYKISFDFGGGYGGGGIGVPPHGNGAVNGTGTLRDAYATWKIAEGIKGKLGRFKEPLVNSALVSENHLLFIDRTAIGFALNQRDLGLAVNGNFDVLGWYLAFQDGADGQADEHKYTARITANLAGQSGNTLIEGAYGAGDNTVVAVGLAYQDDTFLDDGTIVVAEASLNMGPFYLGAEIADFDKGTTGAFGRTLYINDVSDTTPWDVSASFRITPDWEVAARYEDTDDVDDTTSYALGLDYYVHGHDVKWQAQWRKINTDNAVGDSDQLGIGMSLTF
jgi:hypothetical protein